MKKVFIGIVLLVVMISSLLMLTGCGKNDQENQNIEESKNSENESNISIRKSSSRDFVDEENSLKNSDGTYKLGTYVDIGTNILDLEDLEFQDGTSPKADWRLFYNQEETGVKVLILSSYLPNDYFDFDNVKLETEGYYDVYSEDDRTELLEGLYSERYSEIIKDSDLHSNQGVNVFGGPTVEEWIQSWNSNRSYTELEIDTTIMDDNWVGVYVGKSSDVLDQSTLDISTCCKKGYKDTLYFPYTDEINNCYGYWLASPAATGDGYIMRIHSNGLMSYYNYNGKGHGIRPIIYVPSDVQFEEEDGVLKLK